MTCGGLWGVFWVSDLFLPWVPPCSLSTVPSSLQYLPLPKSGALSSATLGPITTTIIQSVKWGASEASGAFSCNSWRTFANNIARFYLYIVGVQQALLLTLSIVIVCLVYSCLSSVNGDKICCHTSVPPWPSPTARHDSIVVGFDFDWHIVVCEGWMRFQIFFLWFMYVLVLLYVLRSLQGRPGQLFCTV